MRAKTSIVILTLCLLGGGPAFARGDRPEKGDFSHRKGERHGSGSHRPPPVEFFRQLLAMTPPEREQALESKPEGLRKFLLSKVEEYEAMPADDRELKLRTTQIRYYLKPLMELAPGDRAEKLAAVPEADRPLVEARLQLWDRLSPELRTEVLENERWMQYFARHETMTPAQREEMLQNTSPDRRRRLEEELARWTALPASERGRMIANFNQFFELSDKEKEKTLNTLSEAERVQMEKTLHAFEKLPPSQRAQCIESFRKFANMTPEERDRFLKNAERWQAMSPGDRETWRSLVIQLPPMPPGLEPPPLPPAAAPPPNQ